MLTRLIRWLRPRAAEPAHLVSGRWGEAKAEAFLRGRGLKILGRRVRVGPKAELDLVARDGNETLVIVEVKTRASDDRIRPAAAVNRRKRTMLVRAGRRYMKNLRPPPVYLRYDIVEVIGWPGMDGEPEIRHIPAAFTGQ